MFCPLLTELVTHVLIFLSVRERGCEYIFDHLTKPWPWLITDDVVKPKKARNNNDLLDGETWAIRLGR
jgi:hypothetical protein